MKFGYISLESIIDEAAGELKRLNRMGQFSKDDAYVQAVECVRLIGGHNFDEASCAIEIRNHVGALPREFYTALEVWKAEEELDQTTHVLDIFKVGNRQFKRSELMVPGDSATVRLLTDKARTPYLSPAAQSYTLKVPPNVIRTSFRNGWVGLQYTHLPKDDCGFVCMQDEQNAIKAVKEYIKHMHLQEAWMAGEVADYVYRSIKTDYETHLDIAKGIQKAADPSHLKYQVANIHNRYRGFKL